MINTNSKRSLFIDHISLTIPVNKTSNKIIIHRNIKSINSLNEVISLKYIPNFINQYHTSWIITIHQKDNTFKVKISYNPINRKTRFFRVEFNPSKAGDKGIKIISKLLIKILGKQISSIIPSQANITRIDITVDRYNLRYYYYALVDNMTYSTIEAIERNQQPGRDTQIIGKGKRRLTIYDKGIEQNSSSTNCMRYEFRIRNPKHTLNNLYKMGNPFNELHLYDKRIFDDELFSSEFKYNVYEEGIPVALNQLNEYSVRRQYVNRLKRYERNIIGIASLWELWPNSLKILSPLLSLKEHHQRDEYTQPNHTCRCVCKM